MLIIGTKEQVEAYRSNPSVNQSSLKNLQNGLDYFLDQEAKNEAMKTGKIAIPEYFIKGSGVDCKLLSNDFDTEFYVSNLTKKPSEVEQSIIELIFKNVKAKFEDVSNINLEVVDTDIIKSAIETIGWQPNWKIETRVDKIVTVGSEFFEELKNVEGKILLDNTQYNEIESIVNSLRTNPKTRDYFNRKILEKSSNWKFYYQLPIFFKIGMTGCKGLLDMCFVEFNPKTNEAIRIIPIDLKTLSGYTIDFVNSVRARRYDIQAAWYQDGLMNPTCKFPEDFPKITINTVFEPFRFIVESTTKVGKPLVYQVTEDVIKSGRIGSPRYGKGYLELLQEYYYQVETGFKEDRIVTESNGMLSFNLDGITNVNKY